jgi:Zn-dependent peptidase ImmA (M78 family)/DNA-binding XRE family transcriptional regulator
MQPPSEKRSSVYSTPNPARLRTARECRGFSKTELAALVGLSVQALTNYEKGQDVPKDENFSKICHQLGFEKSYFFGCDFHSVDAERVTFRSRRSLTATVRRMAIARSKHAADIISPAFRDRFRLPALDLPDLSHETPSEAAELLRSAWNLGEAPVDNMVHLLEAKGVEFFWLTIQSPCVDALSYWVEGRPYIFLNTFKEAGERGRFDTAHELGHLVLHRNRENVQTKEAEQEADEFASAFLLPRAQFAKEAPRSYMVSDYLRLKPRWKVSAQAMVRRGYDLGLFSRHVYESACRTVSARGWRHHEPGQLPREQSALQFQILERLHETKITADEFADQIDLKFTDLFELVPAAIHFCQGSGLSNFPQERQ